MKKIDFATGLIINIARNENYQGQPFLEFMQDLINKGGLVSFIKNK